MKPGLAIAGMVLTEIVIAFSLLLFVDVRHTDFLNFYAAATIVRHGDAPTLYTRETQELALEGILGYRTADYFLHPPFEAAAFVPLTYMPFKQAFLVWSLINAVLLGCLPLILSGFIPLIVQKPSLSLLPFAFLPALTALSLGQDCILVTFLICVTFLLTHRNHPVLAGLILSLATVKFQYVLVLALLLLVARKYRLIAGFLMGSFALMGVCISLIGPAGLLQSARFLQASSRGFATGRQAMMMDFPALLAASGWTSHIYLCWILVSAALLALGIAGARAIRHEHNVNLVLSLFLAIAIAVSPYSHFQDVTVLLPAIYMAAELAIRGEMQKIRGNVAVACCALLFLLPAILLILGTHIFWYGELLFVLPIIFVFAGNLGVEVFARSRQSSLPDVTALVN
jgi:hypothetical protein